MIKCNVQRATAAQQNAFPPHSSLPSTCQATALHYTRPAPPISVRFHFKFKQLLKPPCRANNDAFKCAITISPDYKKRTNTYISHVYIYSIYILLCGSACRPLAAETSCAHTQQAAASSAHDVNVLLMLLAASSSGSSSCSSSCVVLVAQAILHQYHNEGNHIGQHLRDELSSD